MKHDEAGRVAAMAPALVCSSSSFKTRNDTAPAASDDDTTTLIESFNEDFDLGLPLVSDVDLNQEFLGRPGLAQRATNEILAKDSAQLLSALGRFRREAEKVQQGWVSKPHAEPDSTPAPSGPLKVQSSEEREALVRCLIRTLSMKRTSSNARQRPMKRPSNGLDREVVVKDSRSKNTGQPHPYLVDVLPVRSTLSPDRDLGADTNVLDYSTDITDDRLAAIVNGQSPAQMLQQNWELEDQPTICNFLVQKPKTHLITCGATPEEDKLLPNEKPPTQGIRVEEVFEDDDFEDSGSETVNDESVPKPLKNLHNIWPKFNVPKLQQTPTELPFAVMWEVCRIAQHCAIDLKSARIVLENENDWRDQSLLRQSLRNNEAFKNKAFPPMNDDKAWKLALDSGQEKDRAVIYSIEFSYCKEPQKPLYKVKLRSLTLGTSNRIIRRFGADRNLELIIPSPFSHPPPLVSGQEEQARQQIMRWLASQNHRFLGRSWTSVLISVDQKKTKVMDSFTQERTIKQSDFCRVRLFATHGDGFYKGRNIPSPEAALTPCDRQSISLANFFEWAIGVNAPGNRKKTALKQFARLALSYTPTIPTIILEEDQIIHKHEHIGTDMDMADGAGTMSCEMARRVASCLGLVDVPCAFQARIGSCKGMWIVDPRSDTSASPSSDFKKVWIKTYPSQRKFDCPFTDVSHRTFEVKDWPRPLQPGTLNFQFLGILDQNAIDKNAMRARLEHYLKESLREDLTSLQDAVDHGADLRAWMRRCGKSSSDRSANGLVKFLGGAPKSTEEEIGVLLDSGFDTSLPYLCTLLKDFGTKKAETVNEKLKITVPCSTSVLMLPDFSGVLQENEISLWFSQRFENEEFSDNVLEGDVLVGRSPAHLPSDIQKVRAVVVPGLRVFKDVILFSTKGKRSLADKLSGGDFDGDRTGCFWGKGIVQQFRSEEPPEQPDLGLKYDKRTFDDILRTSVTTKRHPGSKRLKETSLDQAVRTFIQSCFEVNTREVVLGRLTKYKERLAYCYSLKYSKVLRMSFLLSALVDAPKQGICFYGREWDEFRNEHALMPLEPRPYENRAKPGKVNYRQEHILDWLSSRANEEIAKFLTDFKSVLDSRSCNSKDGDLTRLIRLWTPEGATGRHLLTQLRSELVPVADDWALTRQSKDFSSTVQWLYERWIDIRPEGLTCHFKPSFITGHNKHHFDEFTLFKAAVTYERWGLEKPKFVFRICGQQLYYLKALAQGTPDSAPILVIPMMYAVLKPDRKMIEGRALARRTGEEMAGNSDSDDDEYV